MVFLDGKRLEGETPMEVPIPAGKSVLVRLAKDGYEPYEAPIEAREGERYRLHTPLRAVVAKLIVETTPKGAKVFLDDLELGTTPYIGDDLRPGKGRALKLVLADHKTVEKVIDLTSDTPVQISETLKSTVVFGYINIGIKDGWAQVSENGKYLGDAPKERFRLRVGKHKLRLTNPASGKRRNVTVEVFAGQTKTYHFSL